MKILQLIVIIVFISKNVLSNGFDVYSIGIFDIKFDGSQGDFVGDYRFERRFDKTILDIGPEEDNFFFLKPFAGFEYTSDNAIYLLTGIYLEDNMGELLGTKSDKIFFTPSFGIGYFDDGLGKKLGNCLEFRSTLEFSYELTNKNRIGISYGHISNANLGDSNPGVEVISLSYQIPY
tara:strand:+ start:26 stop:556 length:531 start_codon:yes stop_codon:yes gene_type:complete